MFSVGITTTISDFKECLKRPGAVAINFISCYAITPLLAYLLAKAIGADGPILAGLVLVGSINGGQASNLCTLIAGGDVALSVLMTTSTTLGCIFMTPLICHLVLGAVVPVDAGGIVLSTFQVVLLPIFLGVGLNTLAVAPFTPVVGVISTVLLVGASVAKCAEPIHSAGLPLQLACAALHLVGGVLGYFATQMSGFDEKTCRTVAIACFRLPFGFASLWCLQCQGSLCGERGLDGHRRKRAGGLLEGPAHHFEQDTLRTGSTVLRQQCCLIFTMQASFQKPEGYSVCHQAQMPEVLVAVANRSRARNTPEAQKKRQQYALSGLGMPSQLLWFRVLLAYQSDAGLLSTARVEMPWRSFWEARPMMASLDHAMWFHHPFPRWRADEWLLYVMYSPRLTGARGLSHGHIFTRDGWLVVSCSQEGLIRFGKDRGLPPTKRPNDKVSKL
eukprot:g24783.t2